MIFKYKDDLYQINDWASDNYGYYRTISNIDKSSDWEYFVVVCSATEGWCIGLHFLMKPLEPKVFFKSEQEATRKADKLINKWLKLKAFL